MEFIDYYQILGIDKSTKAEDVKKAYRKLAHKHHPDLNPNDKDAHKKFQQINEAYKVIGDPEKRMRYDQYGEARHQSQRFEQAQQQPQTQPGTTFQKDADFHKDAEGGHFSEFFESLFGRRNTKNRQNGKASKGQDQETIVQLRLQDVFITQSRTFLVNGRPVRISIPAGVEDGQRIRLKEQGGPGVHGGPAGDLYITFQIADDPVFKRSGSDLHATVDLNLYTAILGGDITIHTLNGMLKLKVPPETQNGTKVRLKGKGLPVYKQEGQYGDLYITYQIKIPTGLSERERDLFAKLSKFKK